VGLVNGGSTRHIKGAIGLGENACRAGIRCTQYTRHATFCRLLILLGKWFKDPCGQTTDGNQLFSIHIPSSEYRIRNLLAYDTFVSDVPPTKIERVALVSQVGERLDVTYRTEIVQKVSCV
jgi:hypothetical protein